VRDMVTLFEIVSFSDRVSKLGQIVYKRIIAL